MKNVMTLAWEMARLAQKRFGGKVKEFFAESLKQAWNEIKFPKNVKSEVVRIASELGNVISKVVRNGKVFVYAVSNIVGGDYETFDNMLDAMRTYNNWVKSDKEENSNGRKVTFV